MHKVAILATGNEIVNGDLLNTNGQAIAKGLFDHCIEVGSHLSVIDDQPIIERAMQFLLADHAAMITIGGLGPTSDDKTRFALSAVVQQPLEFHQPSWDFICARLTGMGLNVAASNRQQALFPQGAEVIPNPNGTAAACKAMWQGKPIYMLPGPPSECLPLFNNIVLPDLIYQGFQQPLVRRSWLLHGIGESNLANELDPIIDHQHCVIGYRAYYPYLELKLEANSQLLLDEHIEKVLPFIQQYIISEQKLPASAQLLNYLPQTAYKLWIDDQATGGLLQAELLNPVTQNQLAFDKKPAALTANDIAIEVSGLTEFWQQVQAPNIQLNLTMQSNEQSLQQQFSIRYGKRDVRVYAVELICWEVLKRLRKLEHDSLSRQELSKPFTMMAERACK